MVYFHAYPNPTKYQREGKDEIEPSVQKIICLILAFTLVLGVTVPGVWCGG